ncbi:sulfurtransferase complex subunit TusD [Moraxella nasovis]|uniref:sulfurtransferase complex subunit TusD n=1 Tax=Moraxella nasovis TaxID=2904121 RepID=UPI001F6148E2|nr:sulfurtransferase complex subunit TusD [Moraxella nasovis]UNU73412.1 sulfurtransferase complex subunit TusD [Moraxella nasovis]
MKKLLLITSAPYARTHKDGLSFAKSALQDNQAVSIFFYGDGAMVANRLAWQSSDVINITTEWASLASQANLKLSVCVSTALARGVCDSDNAKRHHLTGDNLHPAFTLVGLSELALSLDDDTELLQF